MSPQTTLVRVGPDVALADAVPGAAPAALEVAEALQDRFAAADQGCQAADGLAVGLVVGHRLGQHHLGQEGEIGVLGLVVAVGVAVHADEIAVVLQRHEPAQVGAEGAGEVVVFGGLDEKGRVVNDLAEVLHDVVVDLDPHPDLDAALRDAPDRISGRSSPSSRRRPVPGARMTLAAE